MEQRSRHLVDPELLDMLDAWPKVRFTDENVVALRSVSRFVPPPIEHPERVEVTHRLIPGAEEAPQVALTVYRPAHVERALPCVYHMHGGGLVGGSSAMMEAAHRDLVLDVECVLVTIDYRLAPETPFPGPLDDCHAGLLWVQSHADELGIDGRIGVMGESAGGGLAAALALLVRDRKSCPLAFQHLIYPMIDDRTCTRDDMPFAGEYIWPPCNNQFGWKSYLGQTPGAEGVSQYAAAARAEDLAGLPPAYIATGALDLFADENMEYARRLGRMGVPVELHVFPGGFHAFDLHPVAQVAARARATSRSALKRQLHPA